MTRSLLSALAYMQALLAQGWEYPDAHAKAAVKYRVDGDALADAYDAA